jgi:CxxC motif-containing protein (DUF1111 family)
MTISWRTGFGRAQGILALSAAMGAASLLCAAPSLSPLALSGGDSTVDDASSAAYTHAVSALSPSQAESFALGHRMFHNKWAFFWFESAEWGRGPTSNAQACTTCHESSGRGLAPGDSAAAHAADAPVRDSHIAVRAEPALNLVVRVSVPGEGPHGGPNPHIDYGEQLQNFGVRGVVPAEAKVAVEWIEKSVTFADGEKAALRSSKIVLTDLAYGALPGDVMLSPRLAPALVGMGLLEAIPESEIERLAAREPVDGIRGRVNRVWDASQNRTVLGRFGLKANHGSLREQVAAAFLNDIGLSSVVYPEQNCPPVQKSCGEQMVAGKPEITPLRLAATEFYVAARMVPARRNVDDPRVRDGERLFAQAKCAICHVPELRTGDYPSLPQLSHQTIRPYTDLLLHDMGLGLADDRPDFLAGGRDWRTPALWGIGLSQRVNGARGFLHDGRARDFIEAILWHDGEARVSYEAFVGMTRQEREALLAFLESL